MRPHHEESTFATIPGAESEEDTQLISSQGSSDDELHLPDSAPALRVSGLTVKADSGDSIIEDVSLTVSRGEILGIVGESGSGKTTTALALLGYTQPSARITKGTVEVDGHILDGTDSQASRGLRGNAITYVPQNPGTALNPASRVGDAVAEMHRTHRKARIDIHALKEVFLSVGLPATEEFIRRYPHQLSGGQQQRVCIAIALVSQPSIVVLDEPTTGLDVITQSHILEELKHLKTARNLAMIYVTHDLAVVAELADRVAVMYAGRIVEEGPVAKVLSSPKHAYTAELLAAIPDHLRPAKLTPMHGSAVSVGAWPVGCAFSSRCPLRIDACDAKLPDLRRVDELHLSRCIRAEDVEQKLVSEPLAIEVKKNTEPILTVKELRAEHVGRHENVVAARGISFDVSRGECVALVGESGSGKTTIARVIAGLHDQAGGSVALNGVELKSKSRNRTKAQRRQVQIVLQNPKDSLNPKQTVEEALARPLRSLRGMRGKDASEEIDRLLDAVRLSSRVRERYPRHLSGGEQQRVAIARALAAHPDLLVCDEITSALDVSVQSAILETLGDLRRDLGLAVLFITHDLGVVASIADRLMVLDHGELSESGPVHVVLSTPANEYTARLLAAAPSVSSFLERHPNRADSAQSAPSEQL